MKKTCNHLPIFGVGPYFGVAVIALTIIGILLSVFHCLDTGLIVIYWLKMVFSVLGFIIIIFGFVIWFKAAIGPKNIDYYIKENKLCTTGIYSICRNPCYSGIMIMCDGALLIAHNYWLLILPFIYCNMSPLGGKN